jgi:glycosyltransferase involved in cell wall biosynthesis
MKITVLSDSLFIPTGYANQMRQLTDYLSKKGHEIHYLMNAYVGNTLTNVKLEDGQEYNFKMYGSMFGQDYFQNTMSQHLKETKSDVFIILLDTFMLFPWILNLDLSPAKVFFWYPSDGGAGMPKGCEQILKKVDKPIAMSKFGQKQVKDYYGIDTGYIPHGLNVNRFFRLKNEERRMLRMQWGLDDKFVIGVVARNQPRKNLDRTIKIMAKLKDKLPNAVLLLHLDPNDPAQQMFNLPSLIQKYNSENRIIFTGMKAHKGFPWNKMNEVYNLMDVFLLTTSGEGFGIPIIEAMACQVPVLATSYTTTPELVEQTKAGLGIKLSGVEEIDLFKENSKDYDMKVLNGTLTGTWEVERGLCDIDDAVNKLVWMYNNPRELEVMGLNGRKAVLEEYDFEKVGKRWEDEISS